MQLLSSFPTANTEKQSKEMHFFPTLSPSFYDTFRAFTKLDHTGSSDPLAFNSSPISLNIGFKHVIDI